jgi:hypothetical protein
MSLLDQDLDKVYEEYVDEDLEEANYWFVINSFAQLILSYGPEKVILDFENTYESLVKKYHNET